jgi:hypothetical protein
MDKLKIGSAMRFFFLVSGSILWLGIWLTGFDTVHWLLYFPAAFFIFAALTGICPGMVFSRRLFPGNDKASDD